MFFTNLRSENHEIKPPGDGFVDFWSQGFKSILLGLVLSTSGANAKKSSNRASWDWFCRLLEPKLESHSIKHPGTGFLDFWSQGQKVIKSSFLGLVSSYPYMILAQYYIRRTLHYRIIDHWVTSWSPLRGPPIYSPSQWGTHGKYVSTQVFSLQLVRCRCHITEVFVACRVGTPRSVVS